MIILRQQLPRLNKVLKAENSDQIIRFQERHSNAVLEKERQILPGELQMDGFYYAKLKKL